MRAVVQRVSGASVMVEKAEIASIGKGLLAFLGIEEGDSLPDIEYIAAKIETLRIFEDEHGHMGRSLAQVGGSLLLVSQFTLCGDVRHGRRPDFVSAAKPEEARILYEQTVQRFSHSLEGFPVQTGQFQAMMEVQLVNDGPVTILIDSKKRF